MLDTDLKDINCLKQRVSSNFNYKDVEIAEFELGSYGYLAILRGGYDSSNPKEFMDGVVSEYVRSNGFNEFIHYTRGIFWVRVILFGIHEILDRRGSERFQLGDYSAIKILWGGFNSMNPQAFMDKKVEDYKKQFPTEIHDEFIEIFLDNPWLRVVISNFDKINNWRLFYDGRNG